MFHLFWNDLFKTFPLKAYPKIRAFRVIPKVEPLDNYLITFSHFNAPLYLASLIPTRVHLINNGRAPLAKLGGLYPKIAAPKSRRTSAVPTKVARATEATSRYQQSIYERITHYTRTSPLRTELCSSPKLTLRLECRMSTRVHYYTTLNTSRLKVA